MTKEDFKELEAACRNMLMPNERLIGALADKLEGRNYSFDSRDIVIVSKNLNLIRELLEKEESSGGKFKQTKMF